MKNRDVTDECVCPFYPGVRSTGTVEKSVGLVRAEIVERWSYLQINSTWKQPRHDLIHRPDDIDDERLTSSPKVITASHDRHTKAATIKVRLGQKIPILP